MGREVSKRHYPDNDYSARTHSLTRPSWIPEECWLTERECERTNRITEQSIKRIEAEIKERATIIKLEGGL